MIYDLLFDSIHVSTYSQPLYGPIIKMILSTIETLRVFQIFPSNFFMVLYSMWFKIFFIASIFILSNIFEISLQWRFRKIIQETSYHHFIFLTYFIYKRWFGGLVFDSIHYVVFSETIRSNFKNDTDIFWYLAVTHFVFHTCQLDFVMVLYSLQV